jgi:hypothetical protein
LFKETSNCRPIVGGAGARLFDGPGGTGKMSSHVVGKEGVQMKRLVVLVALVLVIALGSYAIFAQPSANMPQGGAGGMMGGGTAGMMNGGMMDNMGCSGGTMMQTTIAATSDGGVVVAAAGKLIKYDATLKKVSEVDIDVDWNAASQKTQQTMANCPMMQMMK